MKWRFNYSLDPMGYSPDNYSNIFLIVKYKTVTNLKDFGSRTFLKIVNDNFTTLLHLRHSARLTGLGYSDKFATAFVIYSIGLLGAEQAGCAYRSITCRAF